jgi:hypothetical protein
MSKELRKVPHGYRVGDVVIPEDFVENIGEYRIHGIPVVKPGVENPMIPPRPDNRPGKATFLGGAITLGVCILFMMVFVGQLLDDNPWALFRDIADLYRYITR